MKDYGLYESAAVKVQTIKTAIEVRLHLLPTSLLRTDASNLQSACLLLRVDEYVAPPSERQDLANRVLTRAASSLLVGRRREDREVCRTWVEEARRVARETWSPRCRDGRRRTPSQNQNSILSSFRRELVSQLLLLHLFAPSFVLNWLARRSPHRVTTSLRIFARRIAEGEGAWNDGRSALG